MKCKNCGYEFKGQNYCPICGEMDLIDDEKEEKDVFDSVVNKNTNEKVVYKVFSSIGYVLGIVSLVLCWCPFMFFSSVPGIVFSKLGVNNPTIKLSYAKKGLTMSIIATVLSVVFTILFFVLVIVFAHDNVNFWKDIIE